MLDSTGQGRGVGTLACGSVVLATMTTLAPSQAALRAMARPIPRDAPVIKIVLPFRYGRLEDAKDSPLVDMACGARGDSANTGVSKSAGGVEGHMAEAVGAMSLVCEWEDCQDRFRSLTELEWHVKRHVDGLQPEEGSLARATETLPSPSPNAQGAGKANFSQGGSQDEDSVVRGALGQKGGTKCVMCQGGGETHDNYLVLCSGCTRPYHQACHRPSIHGAVLRDRHSRWYCKQCALSASSSLHNLTLSIKRK